MITNIQFENFRCFKKMEIKSLKQVALICGRNNAGKTAVLEGIYFILACMRHDILIALEQLRGMNFNTRQDEQDNQHLVLESIKLWRTLFKDMDMAKTLKISIIVNANDKYSKKTLELRQSDLSSVNITLNRQPEFLPIKSNSDVSILNFNYKEDDNELFSGHFELNGNTLSQNVQNTHQRPRLPKCIFLGTGIQANQMLVADWLGKIEMENSKKELVESLSKLIPELADIFVVVSHADTDIFCRRSFGSPLPVHLMGNGVNKLINYLCAIIANPGSIILLDEIEDGFHYSFLEDLWNILIETAKKYDCQIIATSQSRECISAAYKAGRYFESEPLSFYRLDNYGSSEAGPELTAYEPEDLAFAMENDMEVR